MPDEGSRQGNVRMEVGGQARLLGLLTAWLPLVPGLLVLGLLARRSVL